MLEPERKLIMSAWVRNLVLMGLMLSASGLAIALKPTHKTVEEGPRINLEQIIPQVFGDWKLDTRIVPVAVSPDVQEKLDEIYDQTLARTYINSKGEQIMLSIAYGGDQSSDKTQVHRPEFCYAAQGFELTKSVEGQLSVEGSLLPVRRLEASQGGRYEPITYWIVIGDNVTLPGLGRKLIQLRYGITGKVPDGMLVRVSSIGSDAPKAYELHERFVREMLGTLSVTDRIRVAGRFTRSQGL